MDSYERRARLQPALIAAAPAAALLLAAIDVTDLGESSLIGLLAGAVGVGLCAAVRDRGRDVEPGLWDGWGGPPAQRALSLVHSRDANSTRLVRGDVEVVSRICLPSEAEELADPHQAGQAFDRGIRLSIQAARAHKFPVLDKENADYGFRRNLYALKAPGATIAAATLILSLVLWVASGRVGYVVPAGLSLVWIRAWSRVISPEWVKLAADRYATELLRCLHYLAGFREADLET